MFQLGIVECVRETKVGSEKNENECFDGKAKAAPKLSEPLGRPRQTINQLTATKEVTMNSVSNTNECVNALEDRFLSEKEVSSYLGIAIKTLQNWRFRKCGPPHFRFNGSAVRYSQRQLSAWAASCEVSR